MKRCPECRRDYTDHTLNFCLDDGTALLDGPALVDTEKTAVLPYITTPTGQQTFDQLPTVANFSPAVETAVLPKPIGDEPKSRKGLNLVFFAGPVLAVLLAIAGFLGFQYLKSGGSRQISSIAVLPFQNKSSDANSDYLSDGLAESLIFRLSQVSELKVCPTSSVMQYKGKETAAAAIAKELGVDAVMTGRLVRMGDNLMVSVELVDARENKLLWGEQYDRMISDLLAVQREISGQIAQKLKLKLSGESEKNLAKQYTDNNEAYQLYLKGRFYFAKRTKDDIQSAIESYQGAIKLDPAFALAYAATSEAYNSMSAFGYVDPKEANIASKAAAQRALEINPSLAQAHTVLGTTLANYDWNFAEAEREYKRGIELDPESAAAHLRYGMYYLTPVGRHPEAIVELKRATELEPRDVVMSANLAWAYLYARQNEAALSQAEKTYALDPTHISGRAVLADAYNANGMYAETIAAAEKWMQIDPAGTGYFHAKAYAYAKTGRRAEAEDLIRKYAEAPGNKYGMSYLNATVCAALGDRERAFAELEKAYAERDWHIRRLNVDPFTEPLKNDPRFADLVTRVGQPK